MIQYFYTLWNGHHGNTNCYLSPCKAVTILCCLCVCYMLMSYLSYSWKFLPFKLCPLFYLSFTPLSSGNHQLVLPMNLLYFVCSFVFRFLDSILKSCTCVSLFYWLHLAYHSPGQSLLLQMARPCSLNGWVVVY